MSPTPTPPSGRRDFFRSVGQWFVEETSAVAEPFLDDFLERTEPVLSAISGPPVLRPPGAIAEKLFRDTCTSCGKCIQACPEGAIVPADNGLFADIAGTPVILARRRACVWCEPFHCQVACPSGALLPMIRTEVKVGTAEVLKSMCLAHQGENCSVCVTACPIRGKAIEIVRGVPVVHAQECTGCGLCEYACPTHPAAIRVTSRR